MFGQANLSVSWQGNAVTRAFPFLLIACWAAQFITSDVGENLPIEYQYGFFVGPSALFAVFGIGHMLAKGRRIERDVWMLAFFAVVIVAVSLVREDLRTIFSMGFMAAMLMVIVQYRLNISVNFLNIIFLVSMPVAMLAHEIGWSPYSILPSLDTWQSLGWRVSLLPHVATGGFFALVVLFANIYCKDAKLRRLCLGLSFYFMVFSGIRTVIICFGVAGFYMGLRRVGWLKNGYSRVAFFTLTISFVIISVYYSSLLLETPLANIPLLREFIIRDENPYGYVDPEGRVFTVAIRTWMIERQFDLFMSNPSFGVGTFDLSLVQSGYGLFDNMVSGSETYVSGLLARIGIMALVLLYVIFFGKNAVPSHQRDFSRGMKVFMWLAMMFYGSFVNPYDFVFLLMVVGISGGYAQVAGRLPVVMAPVQSRRMA